MKFNSKNIVIPKDMDIREFKLYIGSYDDIFRIIDNNNKYTYSSSNSYFLDDFFTLNHSYTNIHP